MSNSRTSSVCSVASESENLDLFGLFLDYEFSAKAAYIAASRLGVNFVENAEDLLLLSTVQLKRLFPEIGLYNRVKKLTDVVRDEIALERCHRSLYVGAEQDLHADPYSSCGYEDPEPEYSASPSYYSHNHEHTVLWNEQIRATSIGANSTTSTSDPEDETPRFAYTSSEARNAFKQANMQAMEPEAAKWMGTRRAIQVIQSVSFLKQTNKAASLMSHTA